MRTCGVRDRGSTPLEGTKKDIFEHLVESVNSANALLLEDLAKYIALRLPK